VNESDQLSPVSTGFRGRCPRCGEGSLFDGFLKFTRACEGCGESFVREDAGDGPAFFVMSIVSFIVVPLALVFHMVSNASIWTTLAIWMPIMVILALAMLRPAKGLMFNLQWKHDALEIRNEDVKQ
jgi:uncharacterized protein (DUF983 family)